MHSTVKLVILGAALAASTSMSAQQAGAPPATQVWKASDLQAKGRQLATKLDANKVATEPLGTVGNRSFLVAHREGSGLAELHQKQADIIVISAGKVTMVYGGTVVEGKSTATNEIRGTGITGGTEVALGPGDVLHIPAGVPHQMKVAKGAQVTYFVAKVIE